MKEWDAVEWLNARLKSDKMLIISRRTEQHVRALAAEAERRGMLKAAKICRGASFTCKKDEVGEAFAAAIERAAKGEG